MIAAISLNDLNPYLKVAKQSGLVFCDKTDYYGFYLNNEMVGFCGVLKYKSKWVFKNAFVLESHRGNGYHKSMMIFRLKEAKANGIRYVEATCTDMSLGNYIKFGFQVVRTYKKYHKLRLNLSDK